MKLEDLTLAAKEGQAVCLACGAIQEVVALPDEGCSACGDDAVYGAELVLRCAWFVAQVEGDE